MAGDNAQPPFDRLFMLTSDEFPPMSATARVDFSARTFRARTHGANEDHYVVTRLGRSQETLLTSLPDDVLADRFDEYAYAMVVADGMGGAGEVASRLALAALQELALRFGEWRVRVEEAVVASIVDKIRMFYRQIDSALVHVNRTGAGVPLHTSMTAAVSGGRTLLFAHVGHSRAYLFRGGELLQLTRDHTHALASEAARPELLDLTNVASDGRHILTDALGAGTVDPVIDIERLTLNDGDQVMLCTNGLTDVLRDQEIVGVVASTRSVEEQCDRLVERAIAAGASDDVTVVGARYHIPE